MSSILVWFGGDINTLINYLFGLVIIVLYAKDKFNTPTYDKESMGPFSQLPPQLLTIDTRYRQGLRIYIFLLLVFYTALCIIGPSTLNNQGMSIGVTVNTNQLWPVASATFLISAGAAKDSSVLGKIEHFIRQYAQKAAYIPSIVSNLAYAIRNVETVSWPKENKDKLKPEDFAERKKLLTALIGERLVARINEDPRQQGHLAAWVRANIVFYCMQQMFRGVLPSERLNKVVELPENIGIFERLKKEREELQQKFTVAEELRTEEPEAQGEVDLDKLLSEIQRFSKEVSLTIVVLLSQGVRTFSDLNERLEQLGFRDIELRDRSDHLVYLVMVNFSIVAAAFVSYALVSILGHLSASPDPLSDGPVRRIVKKIGEFVLVPNVEPASDFSTVSHINELLIVTTGALIYIIVFKVIDYLREGQLDLSEWRESLQGYVVVVVTASLCSAIIFILLLTLLLYPLGLLTYIWMDLAGLAQQLLFQVLVAGLAAGFVISYLQQACELRWGKSPTRHLIKELLVFDIPSSIKLFHALLAAGLVGVLTEANNAHVKNTLITAAKASLEPVIQSFGQNQEWLLAPTSAMNKKTAGAVASSPPELRLKPDELGIIYCKLRNADAAMNAFKFDNGDFPYNVGEAALENSNAGVGAVSPQSCQPRDERNRGISDQLSEVREICHKLNRVGFYSLWATAGANAVSQSAANPAQPPGRRMIVPTLFRAPDRCELNSIPTQDPNEQNFLGLGNSLQAFLGSLTALDNFVKGQENRAIVTFPMITAFLIAYACGAGCRIWRAWWLNNEAGQRELDKLRDQIAAVYGQPIVVSEFSRWLVSPLRVLNGVAPKEAVRYEGLKTRLYAKIENKQIDFGSALVVAPTRALKRSKMRLNRRAFVRIMRKTKWKSLKLTPGAGHRGAAKELR